MLSMYKPIWQVSPKQLEAELIKKPQILLCSIDSLASKEVSTYYQKTLERKDQMYIQKLKYFVGVSTNKKIHN